MTKKSKKVIIIDDDEIFLETLANVLKLSDLDVYQEKTAESGFEAIVNIEPDLVLLDIKFIFLDIFLEPTFHQFTGFFKAQIQMVIVAFHVMQLLFAPGNFEILFCLVRCDSGIVFPVDD